MKSGQGKILTPSLSQAIAASSSIELPPPLDAMVNRSVSPNPLELRFSAKLKRFLESVGYRDGIGAIDWDLKGEAINGKFSDRAGGKAFEFTIDRLGVTYQPIQWRVTPTQRSDARRSKKRQCSAPTAYSCGMSCITRSKRCRIKDIAVRQAASGLTAEAQQLKRSVPPSGIGRQPSPRSAQEGEVAVRRSLQQEEDRIRTLPYESCAAIDPQTGKVKLRKDGNATSISFTNEEAEKMRGTILTHNHPNLGYPDNDPRSAGYSFSPDDVRAAHLLETKEIRAVSKGYTHSLKPPPGGWSEESWRQEVAPAYARNQNAVYSELRTAILTGKTDAKTAQREYPHLIMKRTAKETGMIYKRTPIRTARSQRGDALKSDRNKGKGIPCGKGYISPDKECRAGRGVAQPASRTKSKSPSERGRDAATTFRIASGILVGSAAVLGLAAIALRERKRSQYQEAEAQREAERETERQEWAQRDAARKEAAKQRAQQRAQERQGWKAERDQYEEEFRRHEEEFRKTYEYAKGAREAYEEWWQENYQQQQRQGGNRARQEEQTVSKDWWDVLGVPPNATRDEIRKAYRDKAKKFHPDVNKSPEAEQMMKDVNAAFERSGGRKRRDSRTLGGGIKWHDRLDAAPQIAAATRKQVMQVLKRSIEESFGAIDGVLAFTPQPNGAIAGKFRDGIDLYDFEISATDELSYIESDANGTRSDAYLMGYTLDSGLAKGVRRDRRSGTAKPKQCLQGKPCKGGCIAKGFKCRVQLSPESGRQLNSARKALRVKTSDQSPQKKPSAKDVSQQYRVPSGVAIAAIAGAAVVGMPIAGYMATRAKYREGFKESAKRAKDLVARENLLNWIPDSPLPGATRSIEAKQISLVVGGFAADEGRSSVKWAKQFQGDDGLFDDHHIVPISNKDFDVAAGENLVDQRLIELKLPLETVIKKGYNETAVQLAATAYAYRQKHPDKPINLVGYSAGGMVTHEAEEILRELQVKNVWVANFGSPYWGLTESTRNSITFTSPNDSIAASVPVRDQRSVNSVTDHFTYLKNSEVRSRLVDFFEGKTVASDRAADNTEEQKRKAERRRRAEERLRDRARRRQQNRDAVMAI